MKLFSLLKRTTSARSMTSDGVLTFPYRGGTKLLLDPRKLSVDEMAKLSVEFVRSQMKREAE